MPSRKPQRYIRYNQDKFWWRKTAIRVVFIFQQVLALWYLTWVWQHRDMASSGVVFVMFFIAELMCFVSAALSILIIWNRRFTRPYSEKKFPTPPSVDIFITVCGEPLEVVRPTIAAACRIHYARKTVYVLDDGDAAEIRQITRELGCTYLARPDQRNRKAGNLNHGLRHSDGQFILALDADQVPMPDVLDKLLGYFTLEHIAFIQTAQDFDVADNDPFGNREKVFYQVEQTGKDAWNASFSCGSAVLYRRKALEEIKGFSTWNIVEDVHTSIQLHARGWRSIYVDRAFSKGIAPEEIWSFYRQRRQWCADSVRILLWDNPLCKAGLGLLQRLQYFTTAFQYVIAAFFLPVFYVLPAWSLLTGRFLVQDPRHHYLPLRLTLLLTAYGLQFLAHYPHRPDKSMRMWCGQFPNFMHGVLIGLTSRRVKPAYRVTPKVQFDKSRLPWLAVLPQLTVMAVNLGAIVYAATYHTCSRYVFIVNVFWVTWICWLLSQICYAALTANRVVMRQHPERWATSAGPRLKKPSVALVTQ